MQRNSSTSKPSSVLFDVWLLTHLTTNLLDGMLRDLAVTADEFGLYSLLHELGPTTPTQVARWTGMAPTTVSGMVRRFTARGHLAQVPNPEDARSRLLELTEEGRRVTRDGNARLAEVMPGVLGALGPHAAATHLGLRRLDRALRTLVGAADRPDQPLPGEPGEPALDAGRLTAAQQREVQQYIRWIQHRDGAQP
ncbi:MarR family winged helix-turn-helix transcriptional regulator [Dactylosporangium sp. AC04546]|uniref:MarR family winged helix-turn-helix transcriptional regulator n=1 Tax=Dactylosporangium sp. AC04546 TaxID=2862460 RepID=UPI001EDE8C2C|nr:MarR family winged helix-turn-helix transcriptional regulator [Dactylosporangium sp. AC04546]WVK88738.1 MarR family winged helix-turn-helix transcriptional regulator [Dactylosporangium sp. AC04546]